MTDQQDSVSGQTGNGERGGSGLSGKTHAAAEQLKNAVASQVEQTRQRAESAKDQTAERIRRVAVGLRHVSETLQPDDELAARFTERASVSLDRFAGYVGSADVRRLRSDAERFSRARPAMFFGGAFLVGLAIGRFFKSSPAGNDGPARLRAQGTSPSLGDWRVADAEPERTAQRETT